MKIRIWGATGNVPAPITTEELQARLTEVLQGAVGKNLTDDAALDRYLQSLPFAKTGTYQGDGICVEVLTAAGYRLILDAGSGIRELGLAIFNDAKNRPEAKKFHLFISHVRLDRMMGFPFFGPAYTKGFELTLAGINPELHAALSGQMEQPFFPVPFSILGSTIQFETLTDSRAQEIGGAKVESRTLLGVRGPGVLKIQDGGKTLVYAPELPCHNLNSDEADRLVSFMQGADLLIADGQTSFQGGGEFPVMALERGERVALLSVFLAAKAAVKELLLIRHHPDLPDRQLDKLLKDNTALAAQQPVPLKKMGLAYDGLERDLA